MLSYPRQNFNGYEQMNLIKEIRNKLAPSKGHSFEDMAEEWWSPDGPMKPLHQMNSCRIGYIVEEIQKHIPKTPEKIRILDLGCGGGIACEPLAILGYQVTGIDKSPELISIARKHAKKSGLHIDYRNCEVADLKGEKFDLVFCLEVLEHVLNPEELAHEACKKTDKLCIFSTLNKTIPSFLLSIVMAEYILRWLPQRTHQWGMYIPPSSLEEWLLKASFVMDRIQGIHYNPLFREWRIGRGVRVNYIASAVPIQRGKG